MRYAILSVLLLSFLSGCNRDATDARSTDGSFLSPASQPESKTKPVYGVDSPTLEGNEKIDGPGEDGQMEGGKLAARKLTKQDMADAKRSGSRRPGATVEKSATSPQQPNSTGNMPTPSSSGKPVIDYDRPIFSISKTPCYGDCEQYDLTLTDDRQLILKARKHMDKKGEYRLRLNAQEYNTLISGLDSLQLDQLPAVFPQNIKMIPSDVQATVLRFPDNMGGKDMKKVEVYSDAPDQLASFLQRFEAMVKREDWKLVKP